jgi:hypothetical protein
MLKKISVVLFAGLFSVAIGAGCKKDDKAEGGSGCDALGKKVTEQAKSEMGDMKDAPPEMKKMAEEMTAKMAGIVSTSCKEDKWSKEAIDCGLKAKDPEKECDKLLTDEQRKKMEERAEKAMGGMMGGDMGGPEAKDPPPAEPTAPTVPVAGGTGLAECDAYVTAMEKYLACDKVPQAARDGAKQGLDAMKSSWGDTAGMPEEAKKAANDACKQAVDALKQGAEAMGCTL